MSALDYLAGIGTGLAVGLLVGEWIWRPRRKRERFIPPGQTTGDA